MKKLLALLLFSFATLAHAQAAPQLTLSWDYSATTITQYGVTGFQIQRKIDTCAGTLPFVNHVVVTPQSRSYLDLGVLPGNTYAYRMTALAPVTVANPKGNSDPSVCVDKTVAVLPPTPPPTNLILTLIQALIDALETYKTGLLDLGR